MVSTTVEKSSSRVYWGTGRGSKSSSRGLGWRAFSSKARVMTDNGVPAAKRSKRGSNSMLGVSGWPGRRHRDKLPVRVGAGDVEPTSRGVSHTSAAFPLPQGVTSQGLGATVKLLESPPVSAADQPVAPATGDATP